MRLTEKIDSLYLEYEQLNGIVGKGYDEWGIFYYNTGEFYSTYGKLENIDFQITLYEYLEELKIELV